MCRCVLYLPIYLSPVSTYSACLCRVWVRGKGGVIVGDLPPYEAFPIGGTNSVRGYSEGEATKPGGQGQYGLHAVRCGLTAARWWQPALAWRLALCRLEGGGRGGGGARNSPVTYHQHHQHQQQ